MEIRDENEDYNERSTSEVTDYHLREVLGKIIKSRNPEGRIDFILELIDSIDIESTNQDKLNYILTADSITR